jgi:hypothetical protein
MGTTRERLAMTMNLWRPWIDAHHGGGGAQPQRYPLCSPGDQGFLGVAGGDEHIEQVADAQQAWTFHTHERAVAAAKQIKAVYGQPVDVVKLL